MLEDIDAEVAVKVMGWELLEVRQFDTEEETLRQRELEDWMDKVVIWQEGDYWINVEEDFWLEESKWKPSENIAQAWQVLEKFPYPLWNIAFSRGEEGWMCGLFCLGLRMAMTSAETASLAICQCALKAMEVVKKHEEMDASIRDL